MDAVTAATSAMEEAKAGRISAVAVVSTPTQNVFVNFDYLGFHQVV